MVNYEEQLSKLRAALHRDNDKYTYLVHAIDKGVINDDWFETKIRKIHDVEDNADFHIIDMIRFLYLGDNNNPVVAAAKGMLVRELQNFPFWPKLNNGGRNEGVDRLVFWSENHCLMFLTSYFLFKQWIMSLEELNGSGEGYNSWEDAIEIKLLKKYMEAHCAPEFNGMYEAMSHVYLPYSMSALLNIYDFSENVQMRDWAKKSIDIIVYQLMLGTPTSNGITNLTGISPLHFHIIIPDYIHCIGNALMNFSFCVQ